MPSSLGEKTFGREGILKLYKHLVRLTTTLNRSHG
jgi:hypothetical protein